MRNLTATICITLAVLLGSAGVSWGVDFQKGLTAHKSGDFATALREWTPLAEQGNAGVQRLIENPETKIAEEKRLADARSKSRLWAEKKAKERIAKEKRGNAENAMIVPTIEKLFQDRVKNLGANEPFYGCIFDITYGEEDLFKQKRKVTSIEIGKKGESATLYMVEKIYEGEKGAPKGNDCFVFKTRWGLHFSEYGEERHARGMANIVKGNFKIIKEKKDTPSPVFKKNITVNQYFSDGRAYGQRRVILEGKVDEIILLGDGNLRIIFASSKGDTLWADFHKRNWKGNKSLKQKLRSLKIGKTIQVRGYFDAESTFMTLFTILNIIKF